MTDEAAQHYFRYRAVNGEGKVSAGVLAAADASALVDHLQERNMRLLACRSLWFAPKSLPLRDWIFLFFNLYQGLNAGVPVLSCLRALTGDGRGRIDRIAGQAADSIEEGTSLSQALADSGGGLDETALRLLEAGEQSGSLPQILRELTDCMKREEVLRARMRGILLYPLFSLILIVAVIIILALWMVPQLQQFLLSVGRELPASALLLMALVRLPLDHSLFFGLGSVLVVALCIVPPYLSSSCRLMLAYGRLKVPYVGTLLWKVSMMRVFMVLRLLYEAGLPLLEAMRYARRAAGNAAMAASLRSVEEGMHDGQSLAGSFEQTARFPPLLVRMISHGELSGSLGDSLRQVCDFYENDLRVATEQIQALIGPAMTVVLGLLLGWAATAFIKPVYELAFSLSLS